MKDDNGVIYILTNPSFPEYVKIGYANDIKKRLNQLNRSECIPFAFRVYATYEVQSRLSDLQIHNIIDKLNPSLRAIENFEGKKRVREFYAMTAEDAYQLLKAIAEINGCTSNLKKVSPNESEKQAEKVAEEISTEMLDRKENFSFKKCGMQIGEEIEFVGNPEIKCKVADDRLIEYKGQRVYMSGLARKLLGRKSPVQGTLYFAYKGEVLSDLRDRLEKEGKYSEEN